MKTFFRQDKTRQDKTRPDKTRQDKTRQKLVRFMAMVLLGLLGISNLSYGQSSYCDLGNADGGVLNPNNSIVAFGTENTIDLSFLSSSYGIDQGYTSEWVQETGPNVTSEFGFNVINPGRIWTTCGDPGLVRLRLTIRSIDEPILCNASLTVEYTVLPCDETLAQDLGVVTISSDFGQSNRIYQVQKMTIVGNVKLQGTYIFKDVATYRTNCPVPSNPPGGAHQGGDGTPFNLGSFTNGGGLQSNWADTTFTNWRGIVLADNAHLTLEGAVLRGGCSNMWGGIVLSEGGRLPSCSLTIRGLNGENTLIRDAMYGVFTRSGKVRLDVENLSMVNCYRGFAIDEYQYGSIVNNSVIRSDTNGFLAPLDKCHIADLNRCISLALPGTSFVTFNMPEMLYGVKSERNLYHPVSNPSAAPGPSNNAFSCNFYRVVFEGMKMGVSVEKRSYGTMIEECKFKDISLIGVYVDSRARTNLASTAFNMTVHNNVFTFPKRVEYRFSYDSIMRMYPLFEQLTDFRYMNYYGVAAVDPNSYVDITSNRFEGFSPSISQSDPYCNNITGKCFYQSSSNLSPIANVADSLDIWVPQGMDDQFLATSTVGNATGIYNAMNSGPIMANRSNGIIENNTFTNLRRAVHSCINETYDMYHTSTNFSKSDWLKGNSFTNCRVGYYLTNYKTGVQKPFDLTEALACNYFNFDSTKVDRGYGVFFGRNVLLDYERVGQSGNFFPVHPSIDRNVWPIANQSPAIFLTDVWYSPNRWISFFNIERVDSYSQNAPFYYQCLRNEFVGRIASFFNLYPSIGLTDKAGRLLTVQQVNGAYGTAIVPTPNDVVCDQVNVFNPVNP